MIKNIMDVSTAHITENDNKILMKEIEGGSFDIPLLAELEDGFIFYYDELFLSYAQEIGLSAAFVKLYELAFKTMSVSYLMVRSLGDELPCLPSFSW